MFAIVLVSSPIKLISFASNTMVIERSRFNTVLTLLERMVLGYVHIRKGPNKVGFIGILQPFRDVIKSFEGFTYFMIIRLPPMFQTGFNINLEALYNHPPQVNKCLSNQMFY